MKRFLSLVLVIATICATTAFAINDVYESDVVTYTAGSYSYDVWSSLYVDNKYQGAVWAATSDQSRVPANYIGVNAMLFDENDGTIVSTGWSYNSTSDIFHMRSTTDEWEPGLVQAGGQVRLYSGTGYVTYDAPRTVFASNNRMISTLANTLVNGQYPVNSKGESYGSMMLEDFVGELPDLIKAKTNEGLVGYIKESDLNPDINTPAQAAAYTQALEENNTIPLYNSEGNVIGTFELETSETIPDALYQSGLARMHLNGGRYPVTNSGKTYGPLLSDEYTGGEEPDLIRVRATNGEWGYALSDDFNGPEIITLEDAAAYMANCPESWTIPVYDLDGRVVGEFEFKSGTIPTSEVQRVLNSK